MDVRAFHVTISLMLAAVAWVGCGFIGSVYLSRGWRERDKRARAVGLLWFLIPTLIMAVWTWPHIAYLWTEHQWRAHFSNPDGYLAGYEKVFERMLAMRWQVFGIYFGVGFAFLFLNLLIARFVCRLRGDIEHWAVTQSALMHRLLTAACLAASGLLAFIVMWQWEAYWNAEAYDKEGVGRVQAIVQHQPALFGTPDNPATPAPWTDTSALETFTEEMEAALEARFADNPNVLFLSIDGAEQGGAKQAPEPPHYFLRGFLSVAPDGKSSGESFSLELTGGTVLKRDDTQPRNSKNSHKKRVSFEAAATEDEASMTEDERRAADLAGLTMQAAASDYLKDGFCDPIFYKNVGYYLFRFPRTRYESMWILAVLFAALALIAYQYRYYYHRDTHSMPRALRGVAAQGSLLWIAILGASAWKADVDRQSMLYLDPLINFNFSDTKLSVDYFYILQNELSNIYMWALAVLACALLVNVFWQNRRLWWWVAVGWASSYLLILWASPTVYNFLWIKPNPRHYVNPYLDKHIAMTRRGFKLDAIQKNRLIQEKATMQDVLARPEVLNNVQLWDRVNAWEWIKSEHVFNLPSHTFHKYMDVDRYHVDGEIRQLLLGVRELDNKKFRSKSDWWTKRQVYTHGYGIVSAPVNETDKDRPRIWTDKTFDIRRPEVYYGELNNDYVFVGASGNEATLSITKSNEVDDKATTRYSGRGGVEIGQGLERWAWATRLLRPIRIGLSKNLDANSRVLLHRHVQWRAEILAPFLKFDKDPYIVIGEESGKLWWVIDVYTTTGRYPYSERRRALNIEGEPIRDLGGHVHSEPEFKGFNYIRNSAVAVVDPYNGDVFFYVTDPHDPLIKMYQHHFGALFQPIEEMPREIKTHLRYPDYLLWTQASMYGRYHMDDAETFRKGLLQWGIPNELIYNPHKMIDGELEPDNDEQAMMPYYTVLTLPGSDKPEFVSVLPMAPKKKDSRNLLSALLVARCDGEHYGDVVCYMLPASPEEKLDGPFGIEERIETEMSKELELRSSTQVRITRGSLLLLPIQTRSGNTALIYVEPVYSRPLNENDDGVVESRPTLRAVFVSAGNEIAYDVSFQKALDKSLRAGLNASIAGVVLDEEGNPIPYVGIQIADKDGNIMEPGLFTKTDGKFQFNQLEAGENYTLFLSKSGLEEKSIPIVTLVGEETNRNVTMSPPAPEKQERTLADMILSAKQQLDLYKDSKAGLTQLESDLSQLIQYARSKNNIALQDLAMSANAALSNYIRSKKEGLTVDAGEQRAQLEADIQAIFKLATEAAANGKP